MKTLIVLLVILTSFFSFVALSNDDSDAFTIHPTFVILGNHKEVYVPKDLNDALEELSKIIPEKVKNSMKNGSENDMSNYHFNLGRWMRNNWGLWAGTSSNKINIKMDPEEFLFNAKYYDPIQFRIVNWFMKKGINHADNMSFVILRSFWRHLNSRPIDIDAQIKFVEDFYKNQAIDNN